jgi:stage II sporulation protein D
MGRIGHGTARVLAIVLTILLCGSCSSEQGGETPNAASPAPEAPIVRVRLLAASESVTLRATATPTVKTASESRPLRLNIAPGSAATLALTKAGWTIGGVKVPGQGELSLWQSQEGSVSIGERAYRGCFRFIPTGDNTFDLVNDVDIDSYLKGVLARELFRTWNEETYRAQAIVARTYALYQARTADPSRHFDLYSDQRSQVYGGIQDESGKSRRAVEDTAGIVVAYGPPGQERIFKTYFSACCGGITQSAADAFGEAYVVPLSDQDVQGLCRQAPRFNWGPVEISKAELTRRLRLYGQRRDRGERSMAELSRLEIQSGNRFNRPIRFVAIDANGTRYSLLGEELRNAINSFATKEQPQKLNSSFVKVINEPASDLIRFVEGHGHGHGVGMCQWCSQTRAEAGMQHEDIVLSAFPRAKLVRAY